jgi:hypothetical protein
MISIDHRALVIGPAGRGLPWLALAVTTVVSAVAVWARALQVESTVDLLQVTRLTSVLMAAGAASCLEDGNEMLTTATPFGRLRRRVLAVSLTGLVTVACWLIVVVGATVLVDRDGEALPVGGLLIELLAMMAFGWLVAAMLTSRSSWKGSGMRAGLGVIIAALITFSIGALNRRLWPIRDTGWTAVHERWITIAVVSMVAFLVTSRDPAGRLGTLRTRAS